MTLRLLAFAAASLLAAVGLLVSCSGGGGATGVVASDPAAVSLASEATPLDFEARQHFLVRTGFGASPTEMEGA